MDRTLDAVLAEARARLGTRPGPRDAARLLAVCNEGYASSLAAVTLRELGLRAATDLDGGFQAWAAAGLPVRPFEG